MSKLPRYVEEQDIEALIESCDSSTAIGLRDRAILLLLARLALRSGDITALQLGDIDWEQALIRVSGKSRRSAVTATAAGCRERPQGLHRPRATTHRGRDGVPALGGPARRLDQFHRH